MYIITLGGYWPAYTIIQLVLALILIPRKQLLTLNYPTDVIIGWLLGLSTAFFWYRVWLCVEKDKSLLTLVKNLYNRVNSNI
jgi:membrane-associated phospholipid phosphatase